MKKIINLLLAAALVAPLSAFAVGAIAVDESEADHADEAGYYIAVGEDSESAAKRAALAGCKKMGSTNCKIAVWFTKCGAYAISKKYSGWGTGKTKGEATNNALDACNDKGCRIVAAECD